MVKRSDQDGSILRGTCWRTKTSRTGQPFGLIGRGFLSTSDFNWLFKFLSTLDSFFALHGDGTEDYLVPSCDLSGARTPAQPLSYAEALYFMRTYLQLPWRNQSVKLGGDPRSYTIHGLKSTLLSWSHQLELPEEQRRLQGKHRPQQSSTRLYSRDDVHGALKLQSSIVDSIRSGFRPSTPLARGGQTPMEEPAFTLQLFKKNLPHADWKYFKFHEQIEIPADADVPLEDDPNSDDESSSSSSSSSASSTEPPVVPKRQPVPEVTADEITGALHRNMWHVAITDAASDLHQIRTACGRRFSQKFDKCFV